MPPWLQEQIGKMQQSQQNLQSILMQKQQVEMENAESDRALEELKKAADDDQVFKYAGTILIKSDKKSLIDELEEKKELSKTKISLDKEIIIELESHHLPHLRANLNSTLRLLQASYDTINSVKV